MKMTMERNVTGESRTKSPTRDRAQRIRDWIAQGFTRVEDIVYVGLALLLAGSALVLLVDGGIAFVQHLITGALPAHVIELLDRILLILMLVEVLYTVQVSFREHTLVPEPFLIVGLIAATRRILVLVAELNKFIEQPTEAFRNAMTELGFLTVLSVALVGSLVMLRRRGAVSSSGADRA